MHCLTPRSKRPFRDIVPKRPCKRAFDDDKMRYSHKVTNDATLLKSPLRNITNFLTDVDNAVTPKKLKLECSNPDTPTCNIKLLTNVAASLEYAKENVNCLPPHDPVMKKVSEPSSLKSRKEKSISVICEKFISGFPEYPKKGENIPISLTEAANRLGVEKRRVYDIINILESVGIVKKSGKNEYTWCGRTELVSTLQSLKNLALLNGLDRVVKNALFAARKCNMGQPSQNILPPPHFFAAFKKERSLGTLARQFLSLFLTEDEPLVIPLTIAVQILLGKTEDISQNRKKTEFKTKVRRLYDVANVLAPLQILQRESKKQGYGSPSFKYCGPSLRKINNPSEPEYPIQSEKQDYLRNFHLLPTKKNGSMETSFLRTRSENWHSGHEPWAKKPQPFPRHSSLQDMCDAVEIERAKLYSSARPQSFNENSNDSCLSFLSSYSTDTSVPESHCEVFKAVDEMTKPLAIPQDSNQNEHKSIVLENVSGNECDCDDGIEKDFHESTLKESEVSAPPEFSGIHRLIQLSLEQQAAILKFLNITIDNGKVALLFIPNTKNNCSNRLNGSSVNKRNSCSTDENTNKRRITLPFNLLLDWKNQQIKSKTFMAGSATNTRLVAANNPANSLVKVNDLYDCAKNKVTVIDNVDTSILKVISSAMEPSNLKKSSISTLNAHTENAIEKNLSNCAPCELMQVLIPVSLNENDPQYGVLNGSIIESQRHIFTNGNTKSLVQTAGNKSTVKKSNGLSAIKEKIVSSPVTVHLKKSSLQNTLPQEDIVKKTENSPRDLKTSVNNTLPIVTIKMSLDKLPYNVIAKKL